MTLVKLKDYKVAKAFESDSKDIFKVLDLTTRALTLYKHYTPVKKVLAEIYDQRAILSAHVSTAEKILKRGKESAT